MEPPGWRGKRHLKARTRAGTLALAVTVASLIVAGGALAVTGALTPQGCISDVTDPAGCGTTQQGLNGVGGVAVTADGRSVYAASVADNAIVRFNRDPASGGLAAAGCIADAGDPAGCGVSEQGLSSAFGVAVTSDGRSVYVASEADSAIVRFDRDPATLALTPAGCISDAGDAAGCGATQQGLGGARGVAVAPDGRSVYVASETDDAVARLDRDPTSGALTPAGCVSDVGDPAGCGATQQGLDRAFGVAVAPEGRSVYVAAASDDAIGILDRNLVTGALTPAGCVSDAGDPAGCGATQQGLDFARTTVVSPDGQSVYVAAGADAAIARFDRDNAPTLTLSAKGRQTSPKRIVVDASCDVDCTVDATGTIRVPILKQNTGKKPAAFARAKRFRLKDASATLEAGETAKLTLKNKRKPKKKLKRALKAGKTAKAAIAATAADAFGDTSAAEEAEVKVRKKRT
jgi:DNA-binding beta-propeller fold protein YncE